MATENVSSSSLETQTCVNEEQNGSIDYWRGTMEAVVEAPLEHVWEVTREFAGIDRWAPSVVGTCEWVEEEGQRRLRRCWAPNGSLLGVERLLHLDPDTHSYSYAMDGAPSSVLPNGGAGYVATFALSPSANDAVTTRVSWSYVVPPIPSSTPHDFQATIFHYFRLCISDLINFLSNTNPSN